MVRGGALRAPKKISIFTKIVKPLALFNGGLIDNGHDMQPHKETNKHLS